jgi:hypothetical protein
VDAGVGRDAATVSGASPEMTFSSTPWARKNSDGGAARRAELLAR